MRRRPVLGPFLGRHDFRLEQPNYHRPARCGIRPPSCVHPLRDVHPTISSHSPGYVQDSQRRSVDRQLLLFLSASVISVLNIFPCSQLRI